MENKLLAFIVKNTMIKDYGCSQVFNMAEMISLLKKYDDESNRLEKLGYSEGVSQPGAVAEDEKIRLLRLAKMILVDYERDGFCSNGMEYQMNLFLTEVDKYI